MELICFILSVAFQLLIAFLVLHRDFKNEKDIFVRIAMVLGISSIILPSIVYFADYYNISAFFNKKGTLNSIEWFQFVSMLASSISGACISGVILYLFNQQQLNYQRHESSESKRIENAPLMKYFVIVSKQQDYLFRKQVNSIEKDSYDYSILLNVANIGLNHAKHVRFEIPNIEGACDNIFNLDNSQSILKKDNDVWICLDFEFHYKKELVKNIKIDVYYEDMLNNNYKQELQFDAKLTSVNNGKFYLMTIIDNNLKVEDEKLIHEVN